MKKDKELKNLYCKYVKKIEKSNLIFIHICDGNKEIGLEESLEIGNILNIDKELPNAIENGNYEKALRLFVLKKNILQRELDISVSRIREIEEILELERYDKSEIEDENNELHNELSKGSFLERFERMEQTVSALCLKHFGEE